MKKHKTSVFIFTRDLRLFDNLALYECIKNSETVIPVFVFNDKQINPKKNNYFSEQAFAFMLESLEDLGEQLRADGGELVYFKDTYKNVLKDIHQKYPVDGLYISKDLTPFALEREHSLQSLCDASGIDCNIIDNHFLCDHEPVVTGDGGRYKVYTPFARKAREQTVPDPIAVSGTDAWQRDILFEKDISALVDKPVLSSNGFRGGREQAEQQMKHIKELGNYKTIRDYPSTLGTTKLSPHLKFGTISAREVYHQVGKTLGYLSHIINELYWRDFYAYLGLYFRHVFERNFSDKYGHVTWDDDEEKFKRWCRGETGYPIVDAGMRELNETGWMHNRVRMIVASFLTKDLHIHWQWGERYFAQKLVDYDPATNNGSWQWAASTGADAQPYFRIFNPWLQQKKFDPDCVYIKKWIPELVDTEPKVIHTLYEQPLYIPAGYHSPMVEHKKESAEAKARFKVM